MSETSDPQVELSEQLDIRPRMPEGELMRFMSEASDSTRIYLMETIGGLDDEEIVKRLLKGGKPTAETLNILYGANWGTARILSAIPTDQVVEIYHRAGQFQEYLLALRELDDESFYYGFANFYVLIRSELTAEERKACFDLLTDHKARVIYRRYENHAFKEDYCAYLRAQGRSEEFVEMFFRGVAGRPPQ